MADNDSEGNALSMDGISEFYKERCVVGEELQSIKEKINEAIGATGLKSSLNFEDVHITSSGNAGEGYGARFTLMVDLGILPSRQAKC